jgi:hypothetical protein
VRFGFRPRYRGLAAAAFTVGVLLFGAAWGFAPAGASRAFCLCCGGAGVALAVLYRLAPAWRYQVAIDDDGLEVLDGRGDRRFRVAWSEVARVVVSPSTRTLWLDGGGPERSLIVPGPGASAPYDIERKAELYAAILARVPADRIEEVDLLETALDARRP